VVRQKESRLSGNEQHAEREEAFSEKKLEI
jgi:hypothetical protein